MYLKMFVTRPRVSKNVNGDLSVRYFVSQKYSKIGKRSTNYSVKFTVTSNPIKFKIISKFA